MKVFFIQTFHLVNGFLSPVIGTDVLIQHTSLLRSKSGIWPFVPVGGALPECAVCMFLAKANRLCESGVEVQCPSGWPLSHPSTVQLVNTAAPVTLFSTKAITCVSLTDRLLSTKFFSRAALTLKIWTWFLDDGPHGTITGSIVCFNLYYPVIWPAWCFIYVGVRCFKCEILCQTLLGSKPGTGHAYLFDPCFHLSLFHLVLLLCTSSLFYRSSKCFMMLLDSPHRLFLTVEPLKKQQLWDTGGSYPE